MEECSQVLQSQPMKKEPVYRWRIELDESKKAGAGGRERHHSVFEGTLQEALNHCDEQDCEHDGDIIGVLIVAVQKTEHDSLDRQNIK